MPYQNVLIPVAPTEDASWILGPAAEITRKFRASAVLLGVVEIPQAGMVGEAEALRFTTETAARLDALAQGFRELGIPVATLVRQGVAVSVILGAISDLGSDLVVLGTHGRTGLRRIVLGSVAEGVVRRSPVPVLVIPAPPSLDTEDIKPVTEEVAR